MTTSLQQSSKDSILQYLLKENKASAQTIAEVINISPQATRRHLKELEEQGLIELFITQIKTGRPQHLYSLSKKGRERFPQNYGEFAVSFLDTLTETVGEIQVSKVLEKQWQRKAENYRQHITGKTLRQRVSQLAQIRKQEGYMAELFCVEEDSHNPPKFFLTEHNCAISDVAESYPQVCSHELEMFASLFPDCKVERTNWINDGEHRCGYLIQGLS
ncbi:iron-sulfur cluster biosynthesis transcriptional regulator SufR [Geminocystis sp. GBBB08]|uniref:iron-sulfur cluster biosynthesis transcriptional regulator SufR n=1 Tax=Geminocystis sp. GBBB08 TaxID=2604140 RepID=UPI0027E32D47|nr:iron-sulfur cluster biosynthesis transcriptional regulator SufR [Geminocystis sp. GBBB08]MBL1211158.1 iron-sulfur cluster biosynthesis transcriptional regulator SufR [Geminocystis sp. GBBB08]